MSSKARRCAPCSQASSAPGSKGSNVEVVDWGFGPNELLTLHGLRVLRAAGQTFKLAHSQDDE
jgi:hypothetical protein